MSGSTDREPRHTIIHDLNNQLAIISASAQLAADGVEPGCNLYDHLERILASVASAQGLVAQLHE